MTETFTSSALCGGEPLRPETITITDIIVTWTQRNGIFSRKTIHIQKHTINSVQIIEKLVGAEIIIESIGTSYIYASHFTKSDARRIKNILIA